MLIDWFTVGAQAVNFIILVVLLRRFLYRPILNAVDAREKKIAAELTDAAAKVAEAAKERTELEKKNGDFDRERDALLEKARADAKAEHDRLLDEARKAADALSDKRGETLRSDAQHLNRELIGRTQREVFQIARKALTDLASTSLDARVADVFIRRLNEMDADAKRGLGDAVKSSGEPALVRSAFELPPEQRAAIQDALNRAFSAEVSLRFETAPDLVSGIELATNGQKVGWSIADYLGSLEKGVEELLKRKERPEAKAEKTAKPDASAEKTAKPDADTHKTVKPEASAEKTAKPDADADKSVKPEAKAESASP